MPRLRPGFVLALLSATGATSALTAEEHHPSGPQSPIDVSRAHSCVAALPRLVATRNLGGPEEWRNTGSPGEEATIRVTPDPPAGTLALDGKNYTLRQYHFHMPSEHRIGGVPAAMEIHYVFEAADGSLAVVARLVDEGAVNAEFDAVLAGMPGAGQPPVQAHSVRPPGGALSPWLDQPRSFRYSGSLTTPPFTIGVSWIVLADRITFSTAQIARFRSLFPHGNTRPVQPIAGRTVRTDVPAFSRGC